MKVASEKKILFVVGAVQFINIVDFMMVMPLGPDFAEALGIPTSKLGIIGASYTFSAFLSGLLGTLYLSRGRLHIDANNPIADKSAYTAIVARQLSLYGGPHLVLNANYDLTNVPVPEGVRGAGQPVSLVK